MREMGERREGREESEVGFEMGLFFEGVAAYPSCITFPGLSFKQLSY